jgi:1-acyl-sn-glycerol-3-phosphate acyltransferase
VNRPGHRPTPGEIRLMRVALAPWRWMTAPRISGHVPVDRPALLAGNHTTLALLDSPLLLLAFHEALGVYPRTVGATISTSASPHGAPSSRASA